MLLRNRFLVLNCAPLPGKYCSLSSCFFAATLKWSCFNFSDITILFCLLQIKKENKELSLHNHTHKILLFILLLPHITHPTHILPCYRIISLRKQFSLLRSDRQVLKLKLLSQMIFHFPSRSF